MTFAIIPLMSVAIEQPYHYRRHPLVEPDWTRLPGWRDVTTAQWEDVQWQRSHCVKNIRQLREVMGDLLHRRVLRRSRQGPGRARDDVDPRPPQMLNTMVPATGDAGMPSAGAAYTAAFYADPVRRYMLPVFSDRRSDWPSHPKSSRDSLHEQDMWVAEGLTHRYPTKVLAELLPTCPQYCGHCTRMDLVGNSTPQVTKAQARREACGPVRRDDRLPARHPDGARRRRLRWRRGEHAVEEPRGLHRPAPHHRQRPRHPARHQGAHGPAAALALPEVVEGVGRVAATARARGVHLAIHTHVNNAQSVTPLVAKAARAMMDAGIFNVRNQGVLMRGVNDTPSSSSTCVSPSRTRPRSRRTTSICAT